MSVQENLGGGTIARESLFGRVRRLSTEKFRVWLLMWLALAALGALFATRYFSAKAFGPNECFLAWSLGVAGCASFGAVVYCFVTFAISKECRYFLQAMAFAALSGSVLAQAVAGFRSPAFAHQDLIEALGWLFGGLAMCGASYAASAWRPANRLQFCLQLTLAGLMLLALPLAVVPYALDPALPEGLPSWTLITCVTDSAFIILSLALFACALAGFVRRYESTTDRIAALLCYFLIAHILGLALRAFSGQRFDDWWYAGESLMSASWFVLIAVFCVESAFAHKEAGDRLEELETLHQVSWSLVGTDGVYELVGAFAHTLRERLGAGIVAVYLSDDGRQTLEVVAVSGPEGLRHNVGSKYQVFSTDRRPGFHSGHTARAFAKKEVQIALDVFVDVEFVPWRTIAGDDGCAASIPLIDQGEAVGVVNLYYAERSHLTPQRLKLLETFVAATSPAIQNAWSRHVVSQHAAMNELDRAA